MGCAVKQTWLSRGFLSSELRDVDPVDVNFGNYLQLAGFRMIPDTAGITLKLRWRALRHPTRRWRCFAHVLLRDRQVSSLDHDILHGQPPITDWEEGDEGYESLRLWMANPPQDVKLRLGVYDPGINVRSAVVASTLPITDESSAVWLALDGTPGSDYLVQFEAMPLIPCCVVFEGGIELAAYSVSRHEELVRLRLKWILRWGGRRGVRFFGHVVGERAPEVPALAQFDQDLAVDNRGPVTAVEQNIVRVVRQEGAAWLRAGLFEPSNLRRLRILDSTAAMDERHRCAYLLIPGALLG